MNVSTLPEIHLRPEDMKHIVELVAKHDNELSGRLSESYHMARFDVFDSSERVRFMCSSLTLEEAVQIQHWIHMAELSAETGEAMDRCNRLAREWRTVSAEPV